MNVILRRSDALYLINIIIIIIIINNDQQVFGHLSCNGKFWVKDVCIYHDNVVGGICYNVIATCPLTCDHRPRRGKIDLSLSSTRLFLNLSWR